MYTKFQILLFYIVLILIFMGIAWKTSYDSDKVVNSLASATIAIGLSTLLWQKYGRGMAY